MRNATEFFWVGNHPGIDLVNTEAVDAHGDRLELVAGLDRPGRLGPGGRPHRHRSGTTVPCGRRTARAESLGLVPPAALARFATCSRPATTKQRQPRSTTTSPLSPSGSAIGPPDTNIELPLDAPGPLERLRLALATTALDATSLDRSRVRRCGSPRCVLLYYDTTKNRSRRWCDMAVCGNRAKANAHYRRAKHRESTPRHPTT